MTNKNLCMLGPKLSTTVGAESESKDDIEDGERKQKLKVKTVPNEKEADKEVQVKTEGEPKKADIAEVSNPTEGAKQPGVIEVDNLSREPGQETVVVFEREKFSITALKRAKKPERLSSEEWADLRAERRRLTKAEKQTKSDNESLFQREMKLWQDKKDLNKERKMFEVVLAKGRRELRKGKEAGVRRMQVSKEVEGYTRRGFSDFAMWKMWKGRPNLNCVRIYFGAAFIFLFLLASFLILMILLNLMPDFENFFR